MTLRKREIISFFSFFSVLFIFPIDGIFYYLRSIYPNLYFPAGLLGIVVGFFLFLFFLQRIRDYSIIIVILGFFFPVVFLIISVQSQYVLLIDQWIIIKIFSYLAIGYFFLSGWQEIENKSRIILYFIYVVLGVLAILAPSSSKENGEVLNYLRTADGMVILAFLMKSLSQSDVEKVVIFFITSIILFIIGSRFSFAAYILSSIIVLYFTLDKGKLFLYFIVLVMSMSAYLFVEHDIIKESRYYRLVFETVDDTSLSARLMLHEYAMEIIENKTIQGEFAYYRSYCNGCYAHNFISFWAEFGIAGIIFFIFSMSLMINRLIVSFKAIRYDKKHFVRMLIIIYVFIGALMAKHWEYPLFYILIGMCFVKAGERKSFPKTFQELKYIR